LEVVEASGCHLKATATTTNAWRVAFDATYSTVLSDFSIPSGKNRYHKYRDKIVEIWKAMELKDGEGTTKDNALYEMAALQYAYFSRATDERRYAMSLDDRNKVAVWRNAAGQPCGEPDNRKQAPSSTPLSRILAKAAPASTSTKKRPAVGAPPTTSPAVATTQRAPAGFATAATASNDINPSEWPKVLLSKLETITVLLETANNNPQMPPKLPILLNDLHRIRVRTTDPGELAIIKPYYLDLLKNYLEVIEYKAVVPHPAALMVDLEGMDLLRQGLRNDPEMLDMVQTAYRRLLDKYLKMINPRIPATAQQKRPRET
jgi:hypothetical protein